ncbi:MAG: tetratricopeptide repeat protein [Acidobacteria bacterium]|nr:tetratricopeptide repeat protein [Acidobacteriota bacterium]
MKQGQYAKAIETLNAVLQTEPGNHRAQQGLLRAYLETGQYEQAEKLTTQFLAIHPNDGALTNLRGEIYLSTGRYLEALAEFQKAAEKAQGAEALRAKLNSGFALIALGKTEEAHEIFRQFITYSNSRQVTSAEELTLIARALTFLEQYHDANDLYLDAIAADPTYIEAHLHAGELYIEKYNYAEAASFFRDALKVNPNSARAHLGWARSQRLDGGSEVEQAVARALEINPNLVEAHNLRAALHLETDQFDKALAELDHSLRVNPHSLEAHSLRAATYYLQNRQDEFSAETQKILAINPRCGELYHTLAEFAVMHRRYHQTIEFARKAIELSPRLWKAHATLGINLLRIGKQAEGREVLEKAFAGDPFNVWTKNTLDLLDSMRDYRESVGKHFLVKLAAKESEVIAPYALELLEEAYQKLTAKYQFTPQGPIIGEVFPNHEDFAVRTLGLPGLGALGVCFGQVIAMDSPSARPSGHFNWGGTAWHEFAHVITLQMTDYKIPRWFSEGLSVYEERQARPGWGDDWTVEYLKAYVDGRFLPIAELDSGFLRPQSPDQVPLAYFQASLICQFIEERFGLEAILRMLYQYKQNAVTPDVVKRVLGLSPEEFDKAFRAYVEAKTAGYRKAIEFNLLGPKNRETTQEALRAMLVKNPDSYFAHWCLGLKYKSEGDSKKAIEHLTRAIALFPYYTGEANPYSALADLYQKQGVPVEAIAVLEQLVNIDGDDFDAHNRLAWLLAEQGEVARAMVMLDRCAFINPFDAKWHSRAGELYLQHDQAARALREFQIVLALDPADKAEAHYNVARALLAQGQRAEAKRAVLKSLEMAPGFEKAQNLLLQIRWRPE